jgi:hypothetical protein
MSISPTYFGGKVLFPNAAQLIGDYKALRRTQFPIKAIFRIYLVLGRTLLKPSHLDSIRLTLQRGSFPGQSPNQTTPADAALTLDFQRRIISFTNFLDPNVLQTEKAIPWPRFTPGSEIRLVFQHPDGNGNGVFVEDDLGSGADKAVCDFVRSKDVEWMR